jgi:hypothetical protein
MNPLEALKQKMIVKPRVEERERVAVIIKGEEKRRGPKTKEKEEQKEKEKEKNEEPKNQPITEIIEEKIEQQKEKQDEKRPLIVDETHKGFDRETLLQKLKEGKMTKIFTKPIIEEVEKKQVIEPLPLPVKKPKKIPVKRQFILESDEEEEEPIKKVGFIIEGEEKEEEKGKEEQEEKEQEVIPVTVPKKRGRITKKVEKGVAILGPETVVKFGDTDLTSRLPKGSPPIHIKASSYYMNDREMFVNFINTLFEPYKQELEENRDNISCDDIGNTSSDFSLLTHQKIVRDYMNLYTPYRGLLLYHGLGAGKTCTSIAIAEGMKTSKNVIIMTPASLRANYIEELKKCGDLIYKRNQYWEWISTTENPELLDTISAILNLPREYIHRHNGAWFINISKPSNYNDLSDIEKKTLEEQLNEMINHKYKFINYNGLRSQRLSEMTAGFTRNLFDNSVVIIDEAHNLISRIVNKIKKEKSIAEDRKGEKEHLPINLSVKLYEYLLSARNAKVILLSGTPVINYPNEFGILFNILRGYIKTWRIPLTINTNKKIDQKSLYDMLQGEKTLDYLDYSPSSKILTITRNPFGFKNKIKVQSGYTGVSNTKKDDKGETLIDDEFISDDDFERKIINVLKRNDIDVVSAGIEIKNKKALPDKLDEFMTRYVNDSDKNLKNTDALKRRILGLSSYFRSAQEGLLPRYNKQLGVDYHIIRVPMSDYQFHIYEGARIEERKMEKQKKTPSPSEDYKNSTSTYRIFSRLFCNFVLPDRPIPERKKKTDKKEEQEGEEKEDVSIGKMALLLKDAQKEEEKQDVNDAEEGEIEGDEVLNKIGGIDYSQRLDNALKNVKEHSNDFLTPEALERYSPKFLHMLENIQDTEYQGLHLVYSQFRTMEGIGLFSLVLEKNGFARFKIKKNGSGIWEIDIPEYDMGKPTYALYTGTETTEEKEMVRHIYNGEWDQIPENISNELRKVAKNNNMGEIIKVFMITSSGSEGINLRNTRYVHIMEPYWHPVRTEQVIGRARRICSHKALPKELQTVEVFVYLMVFTEAQLKSDEAIELKRKDLSKREVIDPKNPGKRQKVPFTSDQYMYEISDIKATLTSQLTEAIKESSFDCYLHSNGKCVNFGDTTNDKFTYVPDYADQQNDTTVRANKVAIEWVGKPVNIEGVDYVYRRISKKVLNIYDKASYLAALKDPSIVPLLVGTLETNDKGQEEFKKNT